MDAPAPVEFSRLEQPEVEPREMAKGHRVPEEVLLEGAVLLVLRFLLLLEVLLYQAASVVVEVLEDEGLVSRILRCSSFRCEITTIVLSSL